ncbi:sulfate/thiosulfate import ATP-binding protein CysA [Clostridium beijerinckii]|uniref:ABC-type quaternary amine transporter n=2 Tax=Clostridium TaxID=1485 RepID=A0AAV3VWS4_9CLOT|nr:MULTISPECIES: ABC transporter ATP-binding protein [Clostridium]ALB44657.1 ABC transporter ATP-binding protein [Clostridium beijerinckii NRRL B-598]MDG5856244.1 ABC transporter ATP-binding protein [Clostridium beijerinckii]NOW87757.1 sulfate transport system ATP-binding protein [Clostridium beijerinckii]NRZ28693.1 sulfate transport system ATP-binding protein [Clostridium beijerinckii]NYB95531.1 sulfate transport system ATP-binding protein [Clostridium beijerinckii]
MYVELKNINKKFGDYKASDNVSFRIEQGKLIGLLGPSGSGKTTILRMIAGLETPDEGDIIINGVKVNDIEPGKRGIGFVFQSYALFRHMTVYDNVAFGLVVQKAKKDYIHERVMELIELIGLKGLEKRYPGQLSGGQRQRVAFARALAPNPQLLLLDEPFAAIDAKVRKELRRWLRETISKLGITSIFVTHDQDEAVEVADEIIITNRGKIEQKGSPVEIYKNPKTHFVAQFIGESNLIDDYTKLKGFEVVNPKETKAIVRPEFIQIAKNDKEILTPLAAEKGIVKGIAFRGNNLEIDVQVGNQIFYGYRSLEDEELKIGEEVFVLIHRVYAFDEKSANVVENKIKTEEMSVFI